MVVKLNRDKRDMSGTNEQCPNRDSGQGQSPPYIKGGVSRLSQGDNSKANSPVIITDTREQTPLVFEHLASERGTLQSGDYSILGLEHDFAVERKSIPDLCGSLTRGRERFERELHRLRGFSFARVIIVGSPHEVQATAFNAKAIFSSISAFEARYGIPFVWEPSPELAARLMERWVWFFWRDRSAIGRKAGPCPIPEAVTNGHTATIAQASQP